MADLSLVQFQAEMAKFAKIVDINLATVVKKIAFDLFTKIVYRTPVDTGRARAGWGISINTPITIVPTGYGGKKLKAKSSAHEADVVNSYQATEGVQLPDLSGIDGTQQVFILNAVEYIEMLEDGSSKQAPAGMVRVSIAEVEAEINALVLANS